MEQIDLLSWTPPAVDRMGATFDRNLDYTRLNAQAQRVWDVVQDGRWWSLSEIAARTHDPEASISARLRDLENLHGLKKQRRRRDDSNVWEYRVTHHDAARRPCEAS